MANVKQMISQEQIAEAVQRLGKQISADFHGRDLTVIGILTGSVVLVSDLMRQITLPHQLGLLQASSYRGTATTPGELKTQFDFLPEIAHRDLLLIDDIFDTGQTLTRIKQQLQELNPRSIRSAVLLWKKSRTIVDQVPDYHCFEIPDEFVVGYGLDYDGHYRHLPFIGVISPDEN